MYSTVMTGALQGVSAYPVSVEVDVSPGLPTLSLVGSLSQEVREAKERVCVALRNAGFHLPAGRITVNLSPANRRKEGTAFDLPIAVGLLAAMDRIPGKRVENTLFLGEVGLDGEIKGVSGVLPIVREAVAWGVEQCIVPAANVLEGALISGIAVRGAASLQELFSFLLSESEEGEALLPVVRLDAAKLFQERIFRKSMDRKQRNGERR